MGKADKPVLLNLDCGRFEFRKIGDADEQFR